MTFAELAFLFTDSDTSARERLHLLEWEGGGAVETSGVGSLYARRLVVVEDEEVVPIEEIRPLLDAVRSPRAWVEIGFATDQDATGVQIFEGSDARVTAVARPFATFEFESIERAQPFPSDARRVVAEFLAGDEPRAVYLVASPHTDGDGLAVRRTLAGAIQLARGDADTAEISETTLDAALAEVEGYLTVPGE